MPTPPHLRRTTADPRSAKLLRVKGALLTPELAARSNREIAREIQVDESTVRRWRAWAAQYVQQPGFPPPQVAVAKRPLKKDAGNKGAGGPKR